MITTDCIRRVNVDDAQCHHLAGSCILIPPRPQKKKNEKEEKEKGETLAEEK